MDPFSKPLQVISVTCVVRDKAVGSAIVTEIFEEHPVASVAVNVYVPATRFVKS